MNGGIINSVTRLHLVGISTESRLYVFVHQENATAYNVKHFQCNQSGTQFHSDCVSSQSMQLCGKCHMLHIQ
jgi:hypothetical protein